MPLSDSRKLLPRKPESVNISSTLVASGASAREECHSQHSSVLELKEHSHYIYPKVMPTIYSL